MPNNGRITLCPFYRDERNKSISCEDTFHRFRWYPQKARHMDMYCDDRWQECPWAKGLLRLYGGDSMGDVSELERLKYKNEALDKELRKTASMLGKAEKRDTAKAKELKDLKVKYDKVEQMNIRLRTQVNEQRNKEKSWAEQYKGISDLYEARFAFLLSRTKDGTMSESAFEEWLRTHEFRIEASKFREIDGRPKVDTWKVTVRETETEK